ncbi:MAG: formate dehydrogenase accessory sulfurtransferase FdhD [Deltaproteobacteria bacterium]|nr:formate dehydrogenase accessory sulfurtransferase FdhD [Deltaproteobacteria bacterium]MBW2016752.1 formate dehydrogenase accessory sulfurtransferase FdhD [Deltaproteobacteria bacterium]MBW2129316.1 formate dehydrogenase accessory sulfurtransferase FdhD [Deltaproteobacteria bacterium]MBW2304221.1 formate dehydrogenase accessory sulfurtransferase FdhD [Deltaproteobacteria bacterium]
MNLEAKSMILPGRQLRERKFTDVEIPVVIERELRIIFNGKHLVTASLMPGMEQEFVTGYLFSQGFIKTTKDISSLVVEGASASVTLSETAVPALTETSYRIVSGGGRTAYTDGSLPEIRSDLTVQKDAVFRAMNHLFDIATVYKETKGVHSAGIFTPTAEPVCIVEEIGRHNCLDKAIGYALLRNIDCSRHFIASTGRMASEMVAKLCRAGFPVVATKTAVTDKGLETAQASGMTLIGFVRDRGTRINTDMEVRVIEEPVMKIYTGGERITC